MAGTRGPTDRPWLRDARRLAALARSGLLDTPPDEAFDRVTRLVTLLLEVPMALVTLVASERQFFKSAVGLPEPWASRRESPLSHSLCQHVVASGAPVRIEDAREHPLGSECLALTDFGIRGYLGVPLRAPSGEVLGTLCAIDVASRVWRPRDEEVLRGLAETLTHEIELRAREEARPAAPPSPYELLVEGTREYAMMLLDPEGRIATWNPGAARIFGFSEDEVVGRPCAVLFTEPDRRLEVPAAKLAVAEQEGQARYERWHVRRDGSRFWATGVVTALRGPEGRLVGFAKVLHDDSRRRQAEDALQALNETLREHVADRSRQVRELAAMLTRAEQEERRRIAHVLHDDLQQVIVAAQHRLGRARQDPGARDAALDALEELLTEAFGLTRSLTADLSPPILKSEGLADALEWLKAHMEVLHGLDVEIVADRDADRDADRVVRVRNEELRVLLFGAVRELLFNVAKHAGTERATVTLRFMRGGDGARRIVITVADEGRGFDPHAAAQRADARTEGGFGLFSVRERLRFFGGDLRVVSSPGAGTRVTVDVPLPPV